MLLGRRDFLAMAAGSVTAGALLPKPFTRAPVAPRIKAIAFDAFPIFDPRPVFALAERLFPGQGNALGTAWRDRQFQYQWLRALGGRYADFLQVTEEALVFAARTLKLELTAEHRRQLMAGWLALGTWPEVKPALATLQRAGIRLAFLSNATSKMLQAGIANSGLEGVFEQVLSTDSIGTFKPDPRAYQMAVDAFGLAREEIAFAAFAGWDAAGARWFGYPTFWVNRMNAPAEELGATVDASGSNLNDLVAFVGAA